MTDTTSQPFEDQIDSACQLVRGAVTELIAEVGGEADAPANLARQLKVSRTLAWRVSRIVSANPAKSVLEFLPGTGSIEILVAACRRVGASDRVVAGVREAVTGLDAIVRTHAGDRSTLDLMLASGAASGSDSATNIMEGRRQAYMGNSAIWGVQGRTRFASSFVAPSESGGGMVDIAVLGGIIGVRRLRHTASVPLYVRASYNDDGTSRRAGFGQALRHIAPNNLDLPLIADFCSGDTSELVAVHDAASDCVRYDLVPGPVGNTAQMTWVFGWRDTEFASIYRDENNRFGEHPARNFVPVETLVTDLFLHRSLPIAAAPQASLFSHLSGGSAAPLQDRDILPMWERAESIGRSPPVVACVAIPRYIEMVNMVYERCGWNPADFAGYRLTVKYPPIPTIAAFRYPLAERPGATLVAV